MEDTQRSGFPYGDILSPNDAWSPAPLTPFTPAPVDPHHDKDTTSTSTSTSDTTLFGVPGQMFNPGGNMNHPSTQPKEMHQLLSMLNRPIQSMGPFASTLVEGAETPDLHQLVSMYPHMFTPAAQVGSSTPAQLSSNLPPLPQSASLMEAHQLITKYMQQNNHNPSSTPTPSTPSSFTPRTPAPTTPASNPTSSPTTTSETSTQALHQLRNITKKTHPEPTTPAPSEPKSSRKSSKSRKKVVEEEEEEEEEMGPPPKRKKGEKEEAPPRVHKLLKHRAIDAKSRNRLASAFESLRSFVDVDHKMDKASLLMAATNLMRDMQKEMEEIKHKLTQETTKRQALEIAITTTPAAGETLSNVRLPNELPLPFFRNLFMDATVQMVVLNLQRQCVEANDAFLKRHGWTREELIGKVIPSASKLIPALGNLYDPNLPFDFAPIKAGYPKNMTAAHLNPYPATILGLQKLFTQQEKSVTVVHRFINGRGQLIEGRVTHWLVLDGGKPQYTVGCTTDESVITLLE